MSPIDDELRSLLHARADVLTPSPDPLGGIERRARRIRRNRVAASVAGAALAVSAVAVAVPLLRPGTDSGATQVATQPPSPQPSPQPSSTSQAALPTGALDPQHPWAYRGTLLSSGDLSTLQAEWSTKHPGATAVPLFGQVYEPSGQGEIVFVSTAQGDDRWGIATSSESGWEFPHDEPLAVGTKVLMAVLAGDEVPRLLVVAAPSSGAVEYAADGKTFRDIQLERSAGSQLATATLAGIGTTALEGDTSADAVRVLDGDGNLDAPVFQGPAPDPTPSGNPPPPYTPPAEVSSAPVLAARYAFDPERPWAYRGTAQDGTGDVISADRKQFATDHGESMGQQDTPLYVVHLSATTDVAVVLHARTDGNWVSFTAHSGTATHQVAYQPSSGEDILSAYVPLDSNRGLLIAVASDQAANVVLQTGDRAEVGGSRTAGIWDWTPQADPVARLAVFAKGDGEPYSSQPAT